jgi:hypothetical protein
LKLRQVILGTVGALAVTLVLAVPAVGQQSPVTQGQYGEKTDVIGGGGGNLSDPGDPSATSDPSTVGSLPFTGLDLGLMAAAAAGLVGAGILIRRRSGPAGQPGA